MGKDHGISDVRFEGMNNGELAEQIDLLRGGKGSETFTGAMDALVELAEGLDATDKTLRDQLADIGVSWTGESADGGAEATEDARVYAEQAHGPVGDSGRGVGKNGELYSDTRHGLPESTVLRGPTEEDAPEGLGGLNVDYTNQVKETHSGRDEAIDNFNTYQSSASAALNGSQALPVPPTMTLDVSGTSTAGISSSSAFVFGPGGGGPAGAGTPGTPPSPVPGGAPPGGLTGATPPGPGPTPGLPGLPTTPGGNVNAFRPPIGPMLMGDAATMMGAGGTAGAGSGAERERAARGGGKTGGAPPKGAQPLGKAPAEEARAARNAERFGAKTGKPGGGLMSPAAAGQRAEGEEDKEHVRRYGVESGDVFDDDRTVAPESIGEDDDVLDDRPD